MITSIWIPYKDYINKDGEYVHAEGVFETRFEAYPELVEFETPQGKRQYWSMEGKTIRLIEHISYSEEQFKDIADYYMAHKKEIETALEIAATELAPRHEWDSHY